MAIDFNEAPEQSSGSGIGIIPPDSCVVVGLHIVMPPQGRAGREFELTKSKNSTLEFLNTELVVSEGRFKGAKIYHRFCVDGATTQGQKKAVSIAMGQLRAALECARNIDPADASPQAAQARRISSWSELEGLSFPIRVGCEPSNMPKKSDPEHYYVNNCLARIVTAKDAEFAALRQPPFEAISDQPVPEFPVNPQSLRPVQGAPAPSWAASSAPAQNGWGSAPAQQTPPAAQQTPAWAQAAPQTDQVPF